MKNFKLKVKQSCARGFTLVELLVYMGLLSILLMIITDIFVSGFDTKKDSEVNINVEQDARYIIARLSYDIRQSKTVTVAVPLPTPTPTPTPVPTPTPTPTPAPTPISQTITFDDRAGQNQTLNGQYPTGILNWGTNLWYHSAPWGLFTTKSVSFNGSGQTSASISFLTTAQLTQLQAYNGGTISSTITLSCTGQPTRTQPVAVGVLATINTNWTGSCATLTVGSTNGWNTNFDNLVLSLPAPTAAPTAAPTPTPVPTPTPPAAPLGSQLTLKVGTNNNVYSIVGGNLQVVNNLGTLNLNSRDVSISNLNFQKIGNGGDATKRTDVVRFSFQITSKLYQGANPDVRTYSTSVGMRCYTSCN